MAEFFTSLFESIFTPGPTAPLVQATNVAFAGLQLILLFMLVATHSVHFIALSLICAGLWFSINWFVRELEASKADPAKQKNHDGTKGDGSPATGAAGAQGSGTGKEGTRSGAKKRGKGTGKRPGGEDSGTETEELSAPNERETTVEPEPRAGLRSAPAAILHAEDTLTKRQSFGGDISGTDSEWDKVSETEGIGD